MLNHFMPTFCISIPEEDREVQIIAIYLCIHENGLGETA